MMVRTCYWPATLCKLSFFWTRVTKVFVTVHLEISFGLVYNKMIITILGFWRRAQGLACSLCGSLSNKGGDTWNKTFCHCNLSELHCKLKSDLCLLSRSWNPKISLNRDRHGEEKTTKIRQYSQQLLWPDFPSFSHYYQDAGKILWWKLLIV